MRSKRYAMHCRLRTAGSCSGFTLIEMMISTAIVSGLLVTLIYTLNYHLSVAERHSTMTLAAMLADEKIYEMEKSPDEAKGQFPEPYSDYYYETSVVSSSFPGMSVINVTVRKGRDEIRLSELIPKAQ